MRVEALSELSCGWLQWATASGQSFATVVAKLTFDIHATQIALSADPEPIVETERHYDDDAARSVFLPSDLVPFKARADVMLVGHVYAPSQQPARVVRARLAIRECDKALEVFGDRAWGMDGEMREGPRFVKMPLRWERSSGGPYTMNPVGIRPDVQDSLGRVLVPNVQPAGKHLDRRGDALDPIGFAPIASSWPSRRLLGEAALAGFPGRAEPGFFNAAPIDQQVAELAEDDQLIMENLHPSAPTVSARFPGMRPRAFVDGGEMGTEVALRCDTLYIDSDRALATLVWRGRVAIEGDAAPVVWVAIERRGSPMTWTTILRLREERGMSAAESELSVTHVPTTKEPLVDKPGVLPFNHGAPSGEAKPGTKTFQSASPSWAESLKPAARASDRPPPERLPAESPLAKLAKIGAETELSPQHTIAMPAYGSAPPPPLVPLFVAPPPAAPPPIVAEPAPMRGREALDLLWFEASAPRRIRAAFQDLFGAAAADHQDEGRRDVAKALARGKRTEIEALSGALARAIDDDGVIVPPTVALAGEIALGFDPFERLRAAIAVVGPFVSRDKALADVSEQVSALLDAGRRINTAAAEGLALRLREAFDAHAKGASSGFFDDGVERMLLERRAFDRRAVLGRPCLRASLNGGGSATALYLPESLIDELPLVARFRAALVGELRPRQDPAEVAGTSLLVLAIGRYVALSS